MGKYEIRIRGTYTDHETYTSEELEENLVILEDGNILENISFREEDGILYYNGKMYTPEMRFMYFPKRDSEEWDDIFAMGKFISVDASMLVRSKETEMKWYHPSRLEHVYIRTAGERIDVVYFSETELSIKWICVMGTDNPYEETPTYSDLNYVNNNNEISVVGVNRFCERIHIPAKIEGVPVKNVILYPHRYGQFVREIVVEEGVERFQMGFNQLHLKIIDIPKSVKLEQPPNEIYQSLWYKKQPNGSIYFHEWFCGIKGTFSEDTLTIKEGTKGIIRLVPLSGNMKRIVLPKSLKKIGRQEFWDCKNLQEIIIPDMEDDIKTFFWEEDDGIFLHAGEQKVLFAEAKERLRLL